MNRQLPHRRIKTILAMRYQSRNNRTAHPLSPVKPPPKIANAPFMHYPTARHVLRGLDEVAKCIAMGASVSLVAAPISSKATGRRSEGLRHEGSVVEVFVGNQTWAGRCAVRIEQKRRRRRGCKIAAAQRFRVVEKRSHNQRDFDERWDPLG